VEDIIKINFLIQSCLW